MNAPVTVLCCGLSCLDIELKACDVPPSRESVVKFQGTQTTAGGSAPQTSRSLAALGLSTALSTAVGDDARGQELCEIAACDGRVQVLASITERPTATAFLPLFTDGTRSCFIDLGANLVASATLLMPADRLETLTDLHVFHFGYPHLMPHLQGPALRALFDNVRSAAPSVLITLDVNGAGKSEKDDPVLSAAVPVVAAIHANLDEACAISGLYPAHRAAALTGGEIQSVIQWLVHLGAGSVFITCGRNGVFAATGCSKRIESLGLDPGLGSDAFVYRPAFALANEKTVNASGAGDAFTAGVIAELRISKGAHGLRRIADAGLASALYRIDPTLSPTPVTDLSSLISFAQKRPRIRPCAQIQAGGLDKALQYAE